MVSTPRFVMKSRKILDNAFDIPYIPYIPSQLQYCILGDSYGRSREFSRNVHPKAF